MPLPGPLFWRALVAFLAFPGVVAFAIPWMLRPADARWHASGLLPLLAGVALLLWCVRDFYVAGRGTLAPWAPPEHLVTSGPYRWSRNPMYVAVLLVLVGWALAVRTRAHWSWAAIMAVAFPLRVVLFEEPWLARRHGAAWTAYAARVRRWAGRRAREG